MKPNDLETAPKLFCESIKVGFTPEFFVMALSSGSQVATFAITPEHCKRLQMYLSHEINEYEKKHKTIVAEWTPNIMSPLQKINPPTDKS